MPTQSQPAATETKPHFTLLATSFAGGPRPRNAALILGALWLVLYVAALFAPPLLDDADATHAQAARAMATTGDLVTLHVDGVRYLEKAPLPYWLVALSFRLFGFNTFAAHLPQAVAVLLLALLGHRWANQSFGARTAFYTAVAILTSVGVFLFTRILIPEVLLSLLLAVALFSFFRAMNPAPPPLSRPYAGAEVREADPPERPSAISYAGPLYPYLMWASLALAVLSKGLVALILFLAPVLLYLWLIEGFRDWRRLRPISGLLLFLAIAAPWHILAGLRNTGGAHGHGFFWFYFWNEHVLRFLGRRKPDDYNRLPGYVFWLQHLLWLFPWSLFLPLAFRAIRSRIRHQSEVLGRQVRSEDVWRLYGALAGLVAAVPVVLAIALRVSSSDELSLSLLVLGAALTMIIFARRRLAGLPASPFHRIDAQQRSILLLSLFALTVLAFFSLSTNQEYYTFPAYLPLLLLIAATVTRAEQTYSTSPGARRWITVAHASLVAVGVAVSVALAAGLWSARQLPYNPDVGAAMAHRGVGSYTLSMSHAFDLTGPAFAAVRLPALLAIAVFLLGPAVAWMLRAQRRHIAATTAVALTGAGFLFAAQLAFVRFAPLLSSRDFARAILQLDRNNRGQTGSGARQVMLFGDQAYGSSIPFYLGEQVKLVDARSSSMLFGSSFPDVPPVFLTTAELAGVWGKGDRKLLFVPQERAADAARLLSGRPQVLVLEEGGKRLLTDRPLPARAEPERTAR